MATRSSVLDRVSGHPVLRSIFASDTVEAMLWIHVVEFILLDSTGEGELAFRGRKGAYLREPLLARSLLFATIRSRELLVMLMLLRDMCMV